MARNQEKNSDPVGRFISDAGAVHSGKYQILRYLGCQPSVFGSLAL